MARWDCHVKCPALSSCLDYSPNTCKGIERLPYTDMSRFISVTIRYVPAVFLPGVIAPIYRSLLLRMLLFNSLSGGCSPTGSSRHGGHWLAYCSLPRVIMMMANLVEWRLAGETEVLGENRPQRHFDHHRSSLEGAVFCRLDWYLVSHFINKSYFCMFRP
jgi:hypothetical protein